MISTLTYGTEKKELNMLVVIERDVAAHAGDDEWKFRQFETLSEVQAFLEEKPLLDIICYEISDGKTLEYLEKIRKIYKHTHLLLLADMNISPMTYLRPGIMANALLLRPWTKEQARTVITELVDSLLEEQREGQQEGEIFKVDGRDGSVVIPYSQIYYFEAREKKIFVCTGKEEFSFYNTMDKLKEELPENFIRCHRSFIVNRNKIRKVMLSQNLILLSDDFDVPLSRSYKAELKGLGK